MLVGLSVVSLDVSRSLCQRRGNGFLANAIDDGAEVFQGRSQRLEQTVRHYSVFYIHLPVALSSASAIPRGMLTRARARLHTHAHSSARNEARISDF